MTVSNKHLAAVCGSHGLSIIDCRPQKNAFAYELIGKGYESTADIKKFIPDRVALRNHFWYSKIFKFELNCWHSCINKL